MSERKSIELKEVSSLSLEKEREAIGSSIGERYKEENIEITNHWWGKSQEVTKEGWYLYDERNGKHRIHTSEELQIRLDRHYPREFVVKEDKVFVNPFVYVHAAYETYEEFFNTFEEAELYYLEMKSKCKKLDEVMERVVETDEECAV